MSARPQPPSPSRTAALTSGALSRAFLVGAALTVACDASKLPTASVLTPEAVAALELAAELPTLPWLVLRTEAVEPPDSAERRALAGAVSLWEETLAVDAVAPDAARRSAVYHDVVPILARRLTPADLEAAHDALAAWLEAASPAVVSTASLDGIAEALARGRALLAEARNGIERANSEAAALSLLEAADGLLETTPRLVALRLIAAGEAGSRPAPAAADRTTSLARTRADRLLRGAREALRQEDYALAIRRAFYARQLLNPH